MKTFLIVALFSSLLLLTSCSKDDFTKAENLKGTQWKSEIKYGGHYYLLKFPGNTSYELHEFEPGEGLDILETGSYTIDEKIIVLNSDDGYIDRVNVEGDKIIWDGLYGEDEIFTKQ